MKGAKGHLFFLRVEYGNNIRTINALPGIHLIYRDNIIYLDPMSCYFLIQLIKQIIDQLTSGNVKICSELKPIIDIV